MSVHMAYLLKTKRSALTKQPLSRNPNLPERFGPSSNFRYHFGLCLLAGPCYCDMNPSLHTVTGFKLVPIIHLQVSRALSWPLCLAKRWQGDKWMAETPENSKACALQLWHPNKLLEHLLCLLACNQASQQAFSTLHWPKALIFGARTTQGKRRLAFYKR